jgi:hypothetical protein
VDKKLVNRTSSPSSPIANTNNKTKTRLQPPAVVIIFPCTLYQLIKITNILTQDHSVVLVTPTLSNSLFTTDLRMATMAHTLDSLTCSSQRSPLLRTKRFPKRKHQKPFTIHRSTIEKKKPTNRPEGFSTPCLTHTT